MVLLTVKQLEREPEGQVCVGHHCWVQRDHFWSWVRVTKKRLMLTCSGVLLEIATHDFPQQQHRIQKTGHPLSTEKSLC